MRILLINLIVVFLLSACATSSKNSYQPTSDVSDMKIVRQKLDTTLYQKPGVKPLLSYSSFFIHPIEVVHNSQTQKMDADTLHKLASYFKGAIERELKAGGYRLLENKADALGIKVKITGLSAAVKKHDYSTPRVVYGGNGGIVRVEKITMPSSLDLSRVNVEADFISPSTGEVDGVVIAHRRGQSFMEPLHKWENVVNAFDAWAIRFREALNEARK